MTTSVRIAFITLILALAAGFFGLRAHNARLAGQAVAEARP